MSDRLRWRTTISHHRPKLLDMLSADRVVIDPTRLEASLETCAEAPVPVPVPVPAYGNLSRRAR